MHSLKYYDDNDGINDGNLKMCQEASQQPDKTKKFMYLSSFNLWMKKARVFLFIEICNLLSDMQSGFPQSLSDGDLL